MKGTKVKDTKMKDTKMKDTKMKVTRVKEEHQYYINLCDHCEHDISYCPGFSIRFGTGIGNDNVVQCDSYDPTIKSDIESVLEEIFIPKPIHIQ